MNQVVTLFSSQLSPALAQVVASMDADQLDTLMASLRAVQSDIEELDEETALALCRYIIEPPEVPLTLAQEMAAMSEVELITLKDAPNLQPDQRYLARAELLYRQGELEEPKTTDAWPIDYNKVRAWRQRELVLYQQDPQYLANRLAFYGSGVEGCIAFINHWADTHDPRLAGKKDALTGQRLEATIPMVLFKRQEEMLRFGFACLDAEANGLIEKSRDMGATWTWLWASIWMWRFWDAVSVGWGTATATKLDRSGDTGSIFVKLRNSIKGLPSIFKPKGLITHRHLLDKRASNPDNGSAIFGEIGEEIGRGSRARVYLIDEAAHLEHPEEVEAALSETTRVRIDMSSVSGLGSVFHRTRVGGKVWEPGKDEAIVGNRTNVFILDWRHHPGKDKEWYTARQQLFASKGLSHVFASEVDRDYAAALQGTIIPKAWLEACVDAHLKIPGWEDNPDDSWIGGFDVADGGLATNAVVKRRAWIVKYADQWGGEDTSVNTRRAVDGCANTLPMFLSYDSVGVGAGVRGETRTLESLNVLPKGLTMSAWNGGAKVQWPGKRLILDDEASPKNKAYFANLKAQGWWSLRMRVYRTYRYIVFGDASPIEELISFDSKAIGELLYKLIEEIAQPTAQPNTLMKLVVDKTPDGAQSPNLGDACMMCCFPLRDRAMEHVQALARPLMVNAGSSCLQCGSRHVHALGNKRYQCLACNHIGDWEEGSADVADIEARSKVPLISASSGIKSVR